ncbi:MAG: hypothetical protein AAFR21_03350 [Pseudomonadota bacterium]
MKQSSAFFVGLAAVAMVSTAQAAPSFGRATLSTDAGSSASSEAKQEASFLERVMVLVGLKRPELDLESVDAQSTTFPAMEVASDDECTETITDEKAGAADRLGASELLYFAF